MSADGFENPGRLDLARVPAMEGAIEWGVSARTRYLAELKDASCQDAGWPLERHRLHGHEAKPDSWEHTKGSAELLQGGEPWRECEWGFWHQASVSASSS